MSLEKTTFLVGSLTRFLITLCATAASISYLFSHPLVVHHFNVSAKLLRDHQSGSNENQDLDVLVITGQLVGDVEESADQILLFQPTIWIGDDVEVTELHRIISIDLRQCRLNVLGLIVRIMASEPPIVRHILDRLQPQGTVVDESLLFEVFKRFLHVFDEEVFFVSDEVDESSD